MRFFTHKVFDKKVAKFSPRIKAQLRERLTLFSTDLYNPVLNNHALNGEFVGCRSINITGDLRLIYEFYDANTIHLLDIDTHANLYGK